MRLILALHLQYSWLLKLPIYFVLYASVNFLHFCLDLKLASHAFLVLIKVVQEGFKHIAVTYYFSRNLPVFRAEFHVLLLEMFAYPLAINSVDRFIDGQERLWPLIVHLTEGRYGTEIKVRVLTELDYLLHKVNKNCTKVGTESVNPALLLLAVCFVRNKGDHYQLNQMFIQRV